MNNQKVIDAAYMSLGGNSVTYIADTNMHVLVPIKQVETITCTAGESTGAGNITMTITSANMVGSPQAVVVAIAASDSIANVITKTKAALEADAFVSEYFDVGGASTTVTLTPKVAVANDSTLAFGFVDTDTTGVTFGASTNTTAGVIPDTSYKTDSSGNVTEKWYKIECITETTFATLTPDSGFNVVGTMTGVAYPIGTIIYGRYTQIDLTGGSILAYS